MLLRVGGRCAPGCRSRPVKQPFEQQQPSRPAVQNTACRASRQSSEGHKAAPQASIRTPAAASSTAGPTAQRHTRRSELGVPSSNRLRIAVDVDEVLGRFLYSLNLYCQEVHGMEYGLQDYWVYEFHKIWNCSQERSNHIVHEFFKSRHFNNGIPVIPGAHDVLSRLGSTCDLVVVTSRQHIIQDATLEWLDRHFPGLFQESYFGNHFATVGTSRKKSEICRNIGAGVLIDDNPTYAIDCAEAGINVLLYDWDHSYPWSKLPTGKAHPLITVVRNWEEVEQAIAKLEAAAAAAAASSPEIAQSEG